MIRIADHKNCDWQIRPFGEVGKEKTKTSEKDNHYSKLNLPQLRKAGGKESAGRKDGTVFRSDSRQSLWAPASWNYEVC